MYTRRFDKLGDRVRIGYFIAFLLLLISYVLSFYTNKRLLIESNWVNHTHQIIHDIDILTAPIKETESGLRGYFITSNPSFLDGYLTSRSSVDSISKEIYKLTNDNPIQERRMDTIRFLIDEKYNIFSASKSEFDKAGRIITISLKEQGLRGKMVMDSIRAMTTKMKLEENRLMYIRSGQIVNFSHFINVINIASLLIAIVMIFYSLLTFNKENTAKKDADEETEKYRQQLELRVTQLDKLNAELVELKSLEKFALTGRISRTIAHEVRNPLTNINLAVEQLRAEVANSEDSIMLLDMISRNGTRINQLISDLLNSTRTNLLNFEKRKINDLLDESLHFAQDRIELKEITVLKDYTTQECIVEVDSQKINIAFLNIIVNACEAMEPQKGTLKIKTEPKNDKCIVTISDNGKGIDADNLSRLFEPYFTTKDNGTGLGLTNTQNIILSHKGSISAESILNEGTKFTIILNC